MIKVDSSELKRLEKNLSLIKDKYVPIAISGALNSAAFDLKKNKIIPSAKRKMISRTTNDNFFRANSKVEPNSTLNISKMVASVGFFENKLFEPAKNYAVKDLEQQEDGGVINMKTFIPTVYARKGNNKKGLVLTRNRITKIREKGIKNANDFEAKSERQKYLFAAKSAGVGGYVLYKKMLWRINSFNSNKIYRTPLYSVSKGRNIKVKGTDFMRLASLEVAKDLNGYYNTGLKKLVDRLIKRA